MKTEAQGNAELHQLCQLIEPIPVAMLTTHDAHGALVSRPMSEPDAAWPEPVYCEDAQSSDALTLRPRTFRAALVGIF